ncbi:MAG: hypothetical protein CMM78_09930 [Rhodospirillaceae bacterium]|nr:hypothetical protein [Rhodospirillales bacterium]MAX48515.1 hypothetical protein [Rhodospirillaceae bacterium]
MFETMTQDGFRKTILAVLAVIMLNGAGAKAETADTPYYLSIPEFADARRNDTALGAFLSFEWYPKHSVKDCTFIVTTTLNPGTRADRMEGMLLTGMMSFIANEDPKVGLFSSSGTFSSSTFVMTGSCDRREEITRNFMNYINSKQDYAVFKAFVPDAAFLAQYENQGLVAASAYSKSRLALAKAAIETQCDPELWRKVGVSYAKEAATDAVAKSYLKALYNAYANAIEGKDIARNIPAEVSDLDRAYILKLVAYQMEHGPCGR